MVCGVVNRHTIPAKNVHPDCTCDLEKMIEAGGCKTKMNFLTPAASQQDCYHCDTMKRNEEREIVFETALAATYEYAFKAD